MEAAGSTASLLFCGRPRARANATMELLPWWHAASVAVRLQLQHLQTATYKQIRIFVRWAVAMHTLICGAQTAAVLQRKIWEHQRPPPPGDEMTGFWKGPLRSLWESMCDTSMAWHCNCMTLAT